MKGLPSIIRAIRQRYLATGQAASAYEINDGLCEAFAHDVLEVLGYPDNVRDLQNENFMCGEDGDPVGAECWDGNLLEARWGIKPPAGLTWEAVDNLDFGNHVWLEHEGRHYDAECPDGVVSPFELPIFARVIERALAGEIEHPSHCQTCEGFAP